jgi:hypothetical protein
MSHQNAILPNFVFQRRQLFKIWYQSIILLLSYLLFKCKSNTHEENVENCLKIIVYGIIIRDLEEAFYSTQGFRARRACEECHEGASAQSAL